MIGDEKYLSPPMRAQYQRNHGHARPTCVQEGTWGADFFGELGPNGQGTEFVIDKHRYSAFIGTRTDQVLRSNEIKTVVVSGVATSGCVESTIRDAFMLDYYVVIAGDACGDYDNDRHRATLTKMDLSFGTVVTRRRDRRGVGLAAGAPVMRVEIWSDIVCPWCYIGKRRFETALADFAHADDVEVVWRAFELDPSAPRHREGSLADHVARKYGMNAEQARESQERLTDLAADEGVEFRFDRAQPGNTFDAHRLVHLASEPRRAGCDEGALARGVSHRGRADRRSRDPVALAVEVGLDPDEAREVVFGDRYTDDVRGEERDAVALGITGRPVLRHRPQVRRVGRAGVVGVRRRAGERMA